VTCASFSALNMMLAVFAVTSANPIKIAEGKIAEAALKIQRELAPKADSRRLSEFDITTLCGTSGAVAAMMDLAPAGTFPGVTSAQVESCFCSAGFDYAAMEAGSMTTLCTPVCQPVFMASMSTQDGLPGVTAAQMMSCMCHPGNSGISNADFDAIDNPSSPNFGASMTALCTDSCQPLLSASMADTASSGQVGSCTSADGLTCCVCSDPVNIMTTFNNNPSGVLALLAGADAACLPIADSFNNNCPSSNPICPGGLPGSNLGSSDNPCFPSSAVVTKADGSKVTVDTLRSGDAIVAVTANGELTTGIVSEMSIAQPEVAATTFLVLTATADKTRLVNLTVTAAHHVPVGAACCSTLKQAGEVEIGETIYTIKNGVAAPSTVTKIAKAVKTGLHSPVLTNGHFPVIDDTVTAFDSATKMHLAAYALPILEPACKATGTCASLKKLVGKITGRKY